MENIPTPLTTKLLDTATTPNAESQKSGLRRPGNRLVCPPSFMAGTSNANRLPIAKKNTAILAGWLFILLGYVMAAIPLLGFVIWVIGFIFCGISAALGVYGAAKGKPFAGIFLVCGAIASFFIYLAIPIVITSLLNNAPAWRQ